MNTIRFTRRVLAAAVSAAWMLPALPSYGASITISDNSCSAFTASTDASGNVTVTCSGSPPPATSCTINAVPTPSPLPASGGSVAITVGGANCALTGSVSGGKAATGSGGTWTDTIPATTSTGPVPWTYSYPGATSVTIYQNGTGGGGGGTAASCPGFANTQNVSLPWGGTGNAIANVSLGGNDIIVASFTTPSTTSPSQPGNIQVGSSTTYNLTASLSLTPCSLDGGLSVNTFFGQKMPVGPNSTVQATFVVGGQSSQYPVLQPNTTYYFNIKNVSGKSFNPRVELQKPPGL